MQQEGLYSMYDSANKDLLTIDDPTKVKKDSDQSKPKKTEKVSNMTNSQWEKEKQM